jgi:hypothetical protein
MMKKIIRTVNASGLPTTTTDRTFGLVLKKRGLGGIEETVREVRSIRFVSAFGDVSIF